MRNRLNSTLVAAIATVLSQKFAAKPAEAEPEKHSDCMSSYGPVGCYRVRCQLGKKCQAAIDATQPINQSAAPVGETKGSSHE